MCSFFFFARAGRFRPGISGRSAGGRGISGMRYVCLHFTFKILSTPSWTLSALTSDRKLDKLGKDPVGLYSQEAHAHREVEPPGPGASRVEVEGPLAVDPVRPV